MQIWLHRAIARMLIDGEGGGTYISVISPFYISFFYADDVNDRLTCIGLTSTRALTFTAACNAYNSFVPRNYYETNYVRCANCCSSDSNEEQISHAILSLMAPVVRCALLEKLRELPSLSAKQHAIARRVIL